MTQLIDSYYLSNFLTGKTADGTPADTEGLGVFRKFAGLISEAVFPVGDQEARWSFLMGTYQRYGWQNAFRFANAGHKMQLVAQLLREVGSPHVVVIYPHPDLIPSMSNVAFEPTSELVERLGLELLGYATA